jgi:hypothetical protein
MTLNFYQGTKWKLKYKDPAYQIQENKNGVMLSVLAYGYAEWLPWVICSKLFYSL